MIIALLLVLLFKTFNCNCKCGEKGGLKEGWADYYDDRNREREFQRDMALLGVRQPPGSRVDEGYTPLNTGYFKTPKEYHIMKHLISNNDVDLNNKYNQHPHTSPINWRKVKKNPWFSKEGFVEGFVEGYGHDDDTPLSELHGEGEYLEAEQRRYEQGAMPAPAPAQPMGMGHKDSTINQVDKHYLQMSGHPEYMSDADASSLGKSYQVSMALGDFFSKVWDSFGDASPGRIPDTFGPAH
ncbi:MAG: hypothetical protein CMG46_00620 [Candidatus Marinimicrobia bacterium]|nr:hypothetical protein [Candidatus Neomarinimicrobiota bacterium]